MEGVLDSNPLGLFPLLLVLFLGEGRTIFSSTIAGLLILVVVLSLLSICGLGFGDVVGDSDSGEDIGESSKGEEGNERERGVLIVDDLLRYRWKLSRIFCSNRSSSSPSSSFSE